MNNNLFLAVIRNKNAIARADNPEFDADDAAYQAARDEFIKKKTEDMTMDSSLKCECCSLPLISGFHVHHIDGDHTNNSLENFSLRCVFCHYIEHTGYVGVKNMGEIVYVPNMPQAHLNLLQVTVFSINSAISEMNSTSQNYAEFRNIIKRGNTVLESIKKTRLIVERNFKTSDPMHFANVFKEMSEQEYVQREIGTFNGLRMLYKPSFFEKEINLWKRDIFQLETSNQQSQLHPLSWLASSKIFRNQVKRVR